MLKRSSADWALIAALTMLMPPRNSTTGLALQHAGGEGHAGRGDPALVGGGVGQRLQLRREGRDHRDARRRVRAPRRPGRARRRPGARREGAEGGGMLGFQAGKVSPSLSPAQAKETAPSRLAPRRATECNCEKPWGRRLAERMCSVRYRARHVGSHRDLGRRHHLPDHGLYRGGQSADPRPGRPADRGGDGGDLLRPRLSAAS